jgi:hypothetical protein
VTDTFVVPTVEAVIPGNQYAADWVGIGGYTDGTLVQTGIQTEVSTINGTSKVTYSAWTEILPQPEKPLPHFTVSAGDTITATVLETTKNRWLMEVDDVTTGQTGSRTVRYVAKGLSAEAIHERPCLKVPCSVTANLATLAQTSDVTFDPGFFSVAAAGTPPVEVPLLTDTPSVAFPDLDLYNVVMQVGDGGTVLATPSSPNAPADDGFSLADGSVAPLPPTA